MTIPIESELESNFVEIGKIVGAHGIRGEVRVHPSTDFPERFEKKGQRWLLRPNQAMPQPIQLLNGYFQEGKGLYIVQFEALLDRNAAEAMRGCRLFVKASDRPPLDSGEFLVADLIGLPVYDQASGDLVGVVEDMMTAGNDLLVVRQAGRKAAILIPFVNPIVPVVDLNTRRIEITPPPGLIEPLPEVDGDL
jgi:16S rRNA processing protein RimM